MTHPYLVFSDSSKYAGKCVGSGTEYGNALSNKSATTIQIPPTFDNKNVVEIGENSFRETGVINIFIPSTVLCISPRAIYNCKSLKEIRFEKGSKLEKIDTCAIFGSTIEKIDLPQSIRTIISKSNYITFAQNSFKCLSYHGTSDFASGYFFSSGVTLAIHTTSSYPSDKFGQRSVSKDSQTCGVSNEPFVKPKKSRNKITCVVEKNSPNDLLLMFFLAES